MKCSLDFESSIPSDDPVRLVSAFVEEMDLSELYKTYGRIRKGTYANTDGSFGGGFSFSETEQEKRCEAVAALHKQVAYCELVSHKLLDREGRRQQSIFSDGTCVEVDLSSGNYTISHQN